MSPETKGLIIFAALFVISLLVGFLNGELSIPHF